MREIKFRAISEVAGEWIYGYYFLGSSNNTHWIHRCDTDSVEPVNKETVGQYTGLKDKKGKEIYEGDIVKLDGDCYSLVYGDRDQKQTDVVEINPVKRTWLRTEDFGYEGECLVSSLETKIVGNIHENPELLEAQHAE